MRTQVISRNAAKNSNCTAQIYAFAKLVNGQLIRKSCANVASALNWIEATAKRGTIGIFKKHKVECLWGSYSDQPHPFTYVELE